MPPADSILPRAELERILADALADLDDVELAAWQRVRIAPELWRFLPKRVAPSEAWVVAIVDEHEHAVWYDEVEGGFAQSRCSVRGRLVDVGTADGALRDVIRALPEIRAARAFATDRPDDGVPPALRGPGRIVRRQTTFVEIETAMGTRARVHFSDVAERHLLGVDYEALAIHHDHPLLSDRRAPHGAVFVSGARALDPEVFERIACRVGEMTNGWRTIASYGGGSGADLRQHGYGRYVTAPLAICEMIAAELAAAGATPSIVGEQRLHDDTSARECVLQLGRSAIVARAFRFEGGD